MNFSLQEIDELINALQLSIESEISSHSIDSGADEITISFDKKQKKDPHLEIFTKLVPGSWSKSGDSYHIHNLEEINLPTLTSFLMLSRLNKESMQKLVELDKQYASLVQKKISEVSISQNHIVIHNVEDWAVILKTQIKEKNLSFSELSRQTGISQVTLHKLKDGGDIRLSTLLKISKALGMDLFLKAK